MFKWNTVEDLTLPKGLVEIGEGAFTECRKLKNITLPNTLMSIRECAFIHCSSLEEIDIPENVKSLDELVFGGCYRLKRVKIHSKDKFKFKGLPFGESVVIKKGGGKKAY